VTELRITSLRCPSCGAPLDGLRRDTVFTCAPCRLAAHISNGEVSTFALRFAPVVTGTDLAIVRLPLWRLDVEVSATGREDGLTPVVWVSAFHQSRVLFFGDPGMDLTEQAIDLLDVEDLPEGTRLVGVTSGPSEASEYARLMVTHILDRRADVTGMEISVAVREAQLWGVPFAHEESARTLTELNTGRSYSTLLVEDFLEIVSG